MFLLYIALGLPAVFAAYICAAAGYLHRTAAVIPRFVPNRTSFKLAAREGNLWWNSQALEQYWITSHDGLRLAGSLLHAKKPSRRVALVLHGHQCVSGEMGFAAKMFWEMGFNVFMPDQRAHGQSEGRFCGMGVFERRDALGWLTLINELFDGRAEIAMMGSSMGAVTAMLAAADPALPANVVCCIEDCGFSRLDLAVGALLARSYRYLPFKKLIIRAGSALNRLRAGYRFEQADCLTAVAACRLPMLFIHGDGDYTVPFEMLRQLYGAHPGAKDMLAVAGARHAVAYWSDPAAYTAAVRAMAERCFSPETA